MRVNRTIFEDLEAKVLALRALHTRLQNHVMNSPPGFERP
jgi:hypothetical protein